MRGFENVAMAMFTKLPDEFPLPPLRWSWWG